MHITSLPSDHSADMVNGPINAHNLYPLINITNVIFDQLNLIRYQCPNGHILNEIIERTELIPLKIKNSDPSAITVGWVKEYHKNLWQLLSDLHDAERREDRPFNLDKFKKFFYRLFKFMEEFVASQSSQEYKYTPVNSVVSLN